MELPSWRLDELGHAGPEHLDPDFVRDFNRKQGTDPFDDVNVLRRHGLNASWTVVDLGAGTGRFSLAVAPHCARVVAVDVSPAMLTVLEEQVSQARLANVECVQAGFLTYEHDDVPPNAIYTRHALHQLPDFWKVLALRRAATMLPPGGLLRLRDLVFDCRPEEVEDVIQQWLEGAVSDPTTGYTAVDLAEHVRQEHSTFRWLLEQMLDVCGFEIIEVDYRRHVYASYTCVRR